MYIVNGELATHLPLSDRSIQFGDGVFRTLRQQQGIPVFWEAHYQKLMHDACAMGIVCPPREVFEEDFTLIKMTEGIVKIILSRGNTARGYAVSQDLPVTRIVQVSPTPVGRETWLQEGVKIRFADWRLSSQPRLAGIKHLNRLDNVMARLEWNDPDIAESLMLDQAGYVIEGVMSNMFLWQQGGLYTPNLTDCGVAGVMRDKVIEATQHLGIPLIYQSLTPEHIWQAEAVLLTNSVFGIVPVRECESEKYKKNRVWRDFSLCLTLYHTIFERIDR